MGTASGDVVLFDPRVSQTPQSQCHVSLGSVVSLAMHRNTFAVCGLARSDCNWALLLVVTSFLFLDSEAPSSSFGSAIKLDPTIRLFDFPSLRPLSSFPFPAGPWGLEFLPQFSSTLAVVSSGGLLEFFDALTAIPSSTSYQV